MCGKRVSEAGGSWKAVAVQSAAVYVCMSCLDCCLLDWRLGRLLVIDHAWLPVCLGARDRAASVLFCCRCLPRLELVGWKVSHHFVIASCRTGAVRYRFFWGCIRLVTDW